MWGANAARYDARRFVKGDPGIGEPNFVTWGLKGPHTCPGRWFAVQTIMIMVKRMIEGYEFRQSSVMGDEEKYVYSAGNVARKEVGGVVKKR